MTPSPHLQIGLAVLFLSWPCSAHAVTLHVTDDIEVRIRSHTHSSNTHKDSQHTERKSGHDSPKRDSISVRHPEHGNPSIGLVKFDVSLLLPDTQIERAILRLWISQLHQDGLLNLHEVLESWEENGLRAKAPPPFGPVFHSLPIGESDEANFLTVDVTTVVQGWLDRPATNFGLALVSDDADALHVEFDSKENRRTSHPMEIEVTLAPGTGPEGPQGIQGPKGESGPPGPAGPPVSLLMLGQNCPTGEFLTGFDIHGNIICNPPPADTPTGPSPIHDVSAGDVIITEFMADPAIVSDTNGEWFEIYNLRPDIVDISGWSIQEANGNIHTISAHAPILIAPGEFLVLGLNADVMTNGGIPVNYQYSNISLNNGGDIIILIDITGETIDQIDYRNSEFAISPGTSLNLDPNHFDSDNNDNGSFWCSSMTLIGAGTDSGTPGMPNEPCS